MKMIKMMKYLLVLLLIASFGTGRCDYRYQLQVTTSPAQVTDSVLTLLVYQSVNLPNLDGIIPLKRVVVRWTEGACRFEFTSPDSIVQVSLMPGHRGRLIFKNYPMVAGDDVSMEMEDEGFSFSGNGAEHFRLMYTVESEIERLRDSINARNLSRIKELQEKDKYDEKLNITFHTCRQLLTRLNTVYIDRKDDISSHVAGMVFDEVAGRIKNDVVNSGHFLFLNGNIEQNVENKYGTLKLLKEFTPVKSDFHAKGTRYPQSYLLYLYARLNFESYLMERRVSYFDLVSEHFDGFVWDQLAASKLLMSFDTESNLDSTLAVVLAKTGHSFYKELLTNLASTFRTGATMPDFELVDTRGKLVSLGEFRGKTVFVHFWFKGCAPCSHYYQKSLRQVEEHFQSSDDVVFIAISLDKDDKVWREAIRSGRYTGESAINLYTAGQGFDHQVCQDYFVKGAPSPFLIDKEGKLISANSFQLGGGLNPQPNKLIEIINRNL